MLVVVALGLVLLFSSYVGVVFHALRADPELLPIGQAGHAWIVWLARGLRIQYIISIALLLVLFTVALHVFPHARVSWRHALAGGIVGTVTKVIDDKELAVEITDGVKVRVQRALIASVISKTEPVQGAKKGRAQEAPATEAPGMGTILKGLFGGKDK